MLTLCIEIPIIYILLRNNYDWHNIVSAGWAASTFTLPFVWFIFPLLWLEYILQLMLSEIFAFLAEAALYKYLFNNIDWSRALLVSFICNVLSCGVGLLMF